MRRWVFWDEDVDVEGKREGEGKSKSIIER